MCKRNALLFAAVSAFALMTVATTANATYQCNWIDGVKECGNNHELGFAPSVGGEPSRDQHSGGNHDSGSAGAAGGSGNNGGSGGDSGTGAAGSSSSDSGSGGGSGHGKGNNGKGNGGGDGSPNGKDDANG